MASNAENVSFWRRHHERASNAESVSISRRHHGNSIVVTGTLLHLLLRLCDVTRMHTTIAWAITEHMLCQPRFISRLIALSDLTYVRLVASAVTFGDINNMIIDSHESVVAINFFRVASLYRNFVFLGRLILSCILVYKGGGWSQNVDCVRRSKMQPHLVMLLTTPDGRKILQFTSLGEVRKWIFNLSEFLGWGRAGRHPILIQIMQQIWQFGLTIHKLTTPPKCTSRAC